jgi:hypothetical protein
MSGMMIIKEVLANMGKGGRSQGKVNYARSEVFTAFLSIMVFVAVLLSSRIIDYRRFEERNALSSRVKNLTIHSSL